MIGIDLIGLTLILRACTLWSVISLKILNKSEDEIVGWFVNRSRKIIQGEKRL
mgnify:CR=1 FL=1